MCKWTGRYNLVDPFVLFSFENAVNAPHNASAVASAARDTCLRCNSRNHITFNVSKRRWRVLNATSYYNWLDGQRSCQLTLTVFAPNCRPHSFVSSIDRGLKASVVTDAVQICRWIENQSYTKSLQNRMWLVCLITSTFSGQFRFKRRYGLLVVSTCNKE